MRIILVEANVYFLFNGQREIINPLSSHLKFIYRNYEKMLYFQSTIVLSFSIDGSLDIFY